MNSTHSSSPALPIDVRVGCSLASSDRNAPVGPERSGRVLLKSPSLGIVVEDTTQERYAFSRRRHACFEQLAQGDCVRFFLNEDKTVAKFVR